MRRRLDAPPGASPATTALAASTAVSTTEATASATRTITWITCAVAKLKRVKGLPRISVKRWPPACDSREGAGRIVEAVTEVEAGRLRQRDEQAPRVVAEAEPVDEDVPRQPRHGDDGEPHHGVHGRAPGAEGGQGRHCPYDRERQHEREVRHHHEVAAAARQHERAEDPAQGADNDAQPGAPLPRPRLALQCVHTSSFGPRSHPTSPCSLSRLSDGGAARALGQCSRQTAYAGRRIAAARG